MEDELYTPRKFDLQVKSLLLLTEGHQTCTGYGACTEGATWGLSGKIHPMEEELYMPR